MGFKAQKYTFLRDKLIISKIPSKEKGTYYFSLENTVRPKKFRNEKVIPFMFKSLKHGKYALNLF